MKIKASAFGLSMVLGLFFVTACYYEQSIDGVYGCEPDGDDCGEDGRCVKAGARWVCTDDSKCSKACKLPDLCVNGTCQCFASCDDRECGNNICDESCGTCNIREWCHDGFCDVEQCGLLKCGSGPNGGICGNCGVKEWCDAGSCKNDCAGLECGSGPNGANCGVCSRGDSWYCDSGKCVDGCAGKECGKSKNGAICGECPSGDSWYCDSGQCVDGCAGKECGSSPSGARCGTCDDKEFCDSGHCRGCIYYWDCGMKDGVNCYSCSGLDKICYNGFCYNKYCVGKECGWQPTMYGSMECLCSNRGECDCGPGEVCGSDGYCY